jgi:hypothetical protein
MGAAGGDEVSYDRWAGQKAKIRADFDAYITDIYGEEQSGVSPKLLGQLLHAWTWAAIRTLEMAAIIAVGTYEGSNANSDDGDSGYDFYGENTAEAMRELVEVLADADPSTGEGSQEGSKP